MNRTLDILGVYVLPLCCFVANYAAGYLGTQLYPLTLWTFGAAGMAAFAFSQRAVSTGKGAGVAAGALIVAAAGAGVIAIPLFFVGIVGGMGVVALLTGDPVGLVFAPGLLGFVPILTATRLAERARSALQIAPWSAAQMAAGAAAILVPTALAFLVEVIGDQRRLADLRSGERERVLRALSPESWYGPRDVVGRPVWFYGFVCENLSALPLDDPAIESAARRALDVPAANSVQDYCGTTLSPRSGDPEGDEAKP